MAWRVGRRGERERGRTGGKHENGVWACGELGNHRKKHRRADGVWDARAGSFE